MTWVALLALGSITWDAPLDCSSQAELEARVGEVHSRVEARVVVVEGRFVLTVTIDDQVRTVTTATCAEAADTAVFLIDLAGQRASPPRKAIEPTAPPLPPTDPPPTDPPPTDPPPTVEKPQPPPRREEAVVSSPAPAREPATGRFHLGAVAGVESILLPTVVARFGLFGQVDLGSIDPTATRPLWRLTLEARGAPSIRVNGGPNASAVAVIAPFFDAQVGLCSLFQFAPLAIGPCVQAGVGVVWATGLNVQSPRGGGFWVWTAGGGARAALSVTQHFELQAFAMLRAGPRPQYSFDGGPVIVDTAPVGLDTGLGIGARW